MSLPGWYTLDGAGNPVRCTMHEANRILGDIARRRVAEDEVDGVRVSTVFLALDHRFSEGPPLLFETMIFGGPHAHHAWRWETRVQALAGHDQVVTAVRAGDVPAGIEQ